MKWAFWGGLVILAGCGAPKQAALPEIEDEGGLDNGANESSGNGSSKNAAESAGPEADPLAEEDAAMHEKCCTNCMDALAKDKSGAVTEEMSCADFTTDLSPWCLEHFRDVPTKISECKAAAPAAAPAE